MRFASFDQMCWPLPEQEGEVAWIYRYQPEQATKADAMTAATIMCAYRDLILTKTQKQRNAICERLKAEYYKTGGV